MKTTIRLNPIYIFVILLFVVSGIFAQEKITFSGAYPLSVIGAANNYNEGFVKPDKAMTKAIYDFSSEDGSFNIPVSHILINGIALPLINSDLTIIDTDEEVAYTASNLVIDIDSDDDGILDSVECAVNTTTVTITGDDNESATGGHPITLIAEGIETPPPGEDFARSNFNVSVSPGLNDVIQDCQINFTAGNFDDGLFLSIDGLVVLNFDQTHWG